MSFLPSSPGVTNLPDVFAKYPKRGSLILRLIHEIMREESPLTNGDRELLFTYISGLNSCDFCYSSHIPAAVAFGVNESVFDQLHADIETAAVDEKLKPILRYVKKLTLTPTRITKTDADAIFAAGWDEKAFVDAISVCCVVNYMNRFVNGVGVNVDSDTARCTGAEVLPTIGYSGWAESLEVALADESRSAT
ncbi:carboxymuconolactone decarboxylase family protein [Methylocaldum sp.]|uniref:carboxymuconolactone decarboxylase family protein n=1 Tax=Methylocaldum sp. TaxID=1969727 RepID=UPI002D6B7E2A|nr:carboxymuconolactone decarboxylase family protein [Methylocaldum sp.]HYE37617.1 carboxymuconolactone decarboxylase family protein [Methylocaldum sp.]